MTGWGAAPWGTSAWGTGFGPTLTVEMVRAATIRSARVRLSQPPLLKSTIVPGDGYNPNTWYVENLTTGELLTVEAIARISAVEVEVFTVETLPPYPQQFRVGAPTLLTAIGVLMSPPSYGDAWGLTFVSQQTEAHQLLDLKNPQLPLNDQPGGTLNVPPGGDYDVHTGIDVLRKLVIRRLTTAPGSFFHMPDYGIGLRLKEPLVTPDLVRLRADIQQQLLKEPEFDAVQAAVALTPDGVLRITIKARLSKLNQEVVIPVEVPTALVSL